MLLLRGFQSKVVVAIEDARSLFWLVCLRKILLYVKKSAKHGLTKQRLRLAYQLANFTSYTAVLM